MQTISNRISKTGEFDSCTFFNAQCTCTSDEHQKTICVECEPETGLIDVTFYTKSFPKDYIHPCYGEGFWKYLVTQWRIRVKKIQWIFSILFKGYIEVESYFSLQGEEQVNDYLSAIKGAMDRIKAKKEEEQRSLAEDENDLNAFEKWFNSDETQEKIKTNQMSDGSIAKMSAEWIMRRTRNQREYK